MSKKNAALKRWNGSSYESVAPRTTWEQVEDKPSTFTPSEHTHDAADIVDGEFSNVNSITLPNGSMSINGEDTSFKLNVLETSGGSQAIPVSIRNGSTSSNTTTGIDLINSTATDPSHHRARIKSVRTNSGSSGAHDLIFSVSNGSSMQDRLTIKSDGDILAGSNKLATESYVNSALIEDTNNYVDGISWNDSTKEITLSREGLSDLTETLSHGHAAADISGLADVATSGNYGDLSGTPSLSISNWNTAYDERVTGVSGTGNTTLAIALANGDTVTTSLGHNHSPSQVGLGNVDNVQQIPMSDKGSNGGVAELNSDGVVPANQLPSYVDSVEGYSSKSNFPSTGETNKIYKDRDTNKIYRWDGSGYTEISASLALGETSSTAYRGDRGKQAYDERGSQIAGTNLSWSNGNLNVVGLADVATSGEYSDLSGTPSLNITNWNRAYDERVVGVSGTGNSTLAIALDNDDTITTNLSHGHSASEISGLSDVATSGNYSDLSGTPSLNKSNWDTAYDLRINNFFGDGNGDVTLSRPGQTSNLVLDLSHTHSISEVSGLLSALDDKLEDSDVSTVALTGNYNDLSGTPSLNKSNWDTAYDLRVNNFFGNGNGDVTIGRAGTSNLTLDLSHTHSISEVSGLTSALSDKADSDDLDDYLQLSGGTLTGNIQFESGGAGKIVLAESNANTYMAVRENDSFGGWVGYNSGYGVTLNAGSNASRHIGFKGSNSGFYSGSDYDVEVRGNGALRFSGRLENGDGNRVFEEDGDTLIIRDNE